MTSKIQDLSPIPNKKGDTWITKETIVLVGAFFIILFLYPFFSNLYAATTSQKDDGSRANFEKRLYPVLKMLMESNAPRDYFPDSYSIGSDKIWVGFDTDWDDTKKELRKRFE